MSEVLARRLKQTTFEGPHHEALLALVLANASLERMFDATFAGTGITQPQYNVLRILNGVYPNAHARCEIADRMLRHAPDLTRMLDRLVRLGLVDRTKGAPDHRKSMARITPKGRALVEGLHPKLLHVNQLLADLMSADEARALADLLEKVYASD